MNNGRKKPADSNPLSLTIKKLGGND